MKVKSHLEVFQKGAKAKSKWKVTYIGRSVLLIENVFLGLRLHCFLSMKTVMMTFDICR